MTTFTSDDVGKAVETADGETLGVVIAVDRETAYVEPESGIGETIRATLGWGDPSDDAVPLADDAVRDITPDAIVLAEAVPEDSIEFENVEERPEASDRRDVEPSRGDPVDPLGSETRADVGDTESGARGSDRRPEADDLGRQEPGTDAAEEIDGDAERRDADDRSSVEEMDPVGEMDGPEEMEPVDEIESAGEMGDAEGLEGADEMAGADELDSVESDASRDLEVDPTELTDRDPEVEMRPGEDVGDRTDAEVDPEDLEADDLRGPTTEDAGATPEDERAERDERDDDERR